MPLDAPTTAFFSYCREDSEFAIRLAEDLKAAGASVWLDQLDIEPGMPWDRAVENAVTGSPRMLVILSPVSVNSDNVRDEVSFALSKQKRVIPVLYRECEIPFRLARLQHIDFRTDYARGLKTLLKTLGAEQPAAATAAPVGSQPVISDVEREGVAEQQRLEDERKQAAEYARLEARSKQAAAEKARLEREERERLAAEQARVEEERRRAAEQDRLENERKQAAEQARLEQERRLAAEQARLEEERKQLAAEKARLAQQERARLEQQRVGPPGPPPAMDSPQGRVGPPAPSPGIVPPAFNKTALVAGGIVVAALVVYWATRPKPQQVVTQTPAAQTQPASPPPANEVASDKAAADKAAADKAAADKLAEDKAAARKVAADKAAADKAAGVKQPATESLTPQAMYEKGIDYYVGRNGVSKEYKQAAIWFRKAAEAGNAEGMKNLGVMYENGYGVPKDYKQAVSWYRKAADAGNPTGMAYLGFMYEDGRGVEKDLQKAIAWYRKAAQLGDQNAKDLLKRLGESP